MTALKMLAVLAVVAVFDSGCTMEPAGVDSERGAIRGGTEVVGHRGLVEIDDSCTGWILNERVIVTAAHCVEGLSRPQTFYIDYFHPKRGKERIWSDELQYRVHPNFGGWTCDPTLGCDYADHDVAVLWNSSRWPRTNYRDYLRVYQDYGNRIEEVRVWGAGFDTRSGEGDGILRHHLFSLNHDPSYWILETEGTADYNVCRGDSGGPAIKEAGGMEWVTAVASFVETWGPFGDNCSRENGDQWHTRINGQHLDWIAETTGSECTRLSAYSYDYKRCFDVPFVNDVEEEGLARSRAAAQALSFL